MAEKKDGKLKINGVDVIASIIMLLGLLRIFKIGALSKQLDNTTLLYFCTGAALFLLKRAKSFKFGDLQVDLQQLKEDVKEAKLVAGIAEDAAKTSSVPVTERDRNFNKRNAVAEAAAVAEIVPGTAPDDPWKGVFGGKSISKNPGRALSAEVTPLKDSPGWYSVKLQVESLPDSNPLQGTIQFFIHDTFPNNKPVVHAVNGQAILRLKAWGAFTVGVLADEGQTKLELDLAEQGNAPMEFRMR